MRFQRTESAALLNGYEAARRFFSSCFRSKGEAHERPWVAHVDHAARCLHVECYEGEPESVDKPVREIIVDAARLGSADGVLAHHHLRDARPSNANCRSTRKLTRAAEALDLAVLDHLIFAGRDCSSTRRMGLLQSLPSRA